MKHITIVTRNLFGGGAERVISELVKYTSAHSIKSTIITIDNEEVFYELPQDVEIYPIGKKSNIHIIDKFLKYKEVRKYSKKIETDIILSLPEDIGIYVIPAMIGSNIPVVVSERNNPWVMPWKKESRLMRKLFYPFASGFIFQTEYAASYFSKKIRKKGIVLPNPLDLNRIPKPYEGERKKEVVGAGRLVEQKNFPLLIKAFAEFQKVYPEYTLTIYGEGNLKEDLEKLAKEHIVKNKYKFAGKTNELLESIKSASMFVLSSDYEGMPNVLIEAMAIGMPVISTDCPSGGPSELIDNDKNGLLVPVNDVKKLSDAMCRVAESNKLSKKISMNAQNIKYILDANVVSKKWIQYLNKIVDENVRN